MTNTETNVAAQAGDEPMLDALMAEWFGDEFTGVFNPHRIKAYSRALIATQVSPRATADVERDACTWTHEEDNYAWASACGELWSFIDGGPEENRVKFCQGCGKPVDIATTKPGA